MTSTRTIDLTALERSEAYALLNSAIVPRPIAWVGTVSAAGEHNLAPHSYSTVASAAPPMLLFTSIRHKDTIANIEETKCFTVNSVPHALVDRMNVTAADAPHGVSEFELAGLTPVVGDNVRAPRVAESPVSFECELDRIIELGTDPSFVIIGRAVAMHVSDDMWNERGRVDPAKLDAVARLGGISYSTIRDRFDLVRPTYADLTKE